MELAAAILFAGPLGYLARSRKQGLGLYLVLWAVVFVVQTAVVNASAPDDINVLYFVFNALILAGGIALNALGAHLQDRRARRVGSVGA